MSPASTLAASTDPASTASPGGVRSLLFTGKGGVGKTTLAAATALTVAASEARIGARTLLLSTDPAHSLADVLGCPLTSVPAPVAGVPGLWAAEVAVRDRFEAAWSDIRGYLVGVLQTRGIAEITAEELVAFPGADEILALLELEQFARSGEFDVIVVDCAPTGETLRLLALPETLRFYADRLMGAPQRLLRVIAAGVAGRTAATPDGRIRDAVTDVLDRLTALRALLTAPGGGVTIVTTAEQVAVAEARRAYTALSLHGYRVSSVIVNRLIPDEADGAWIDHIRAAQAVQLAAVAESFAGIPQHRALLRVAEPVGPAALGRLGAEVYRGANPLLDGHIAPGLTVGGADGAYTLAFPLPLVERGDVELSRSGDDLVVTVGPHRRRIALPSLLQRCLAVAATFRDGSLVVDFVPDPAQWPSRVGA